MNQYDVAIIGGGIVGLATAYQLSVAQPNLSLLILEKEPSLATHQSGHNSGVLHSGIYYKPGSLKAENCRQGKLAMQQFCEHHNIDFEICGKVIVAVDESELPALQRIYERGQQNGVKCQPIDAAQLRELEPHVSGIKAIHVPEAGIVDYTQVCTRLADIVISAGSEIKTNASVLKIRTNSSSSRLVTNTGEYETRLIVNCAGLYSDRVTKMTGFKPEAKIVPFRGEYYKIVSSRYHLCRNLIYPVPDPNFPFLGVHFTRMIDGTVECGPNAVLAFAREGYTKSKINLRDLLESITYPGFWRLALRHWKMGTAEMWRSISRRAFVTALKRLIPEIESADLDPAPSGVRAQALLPNGNLVDDFLVNESDRAISINNAPSPGATASLNIGRLIASKVAERL